MKVDISCDHIFLLVIIVVGITIYIMNCNNNIEGFATTIADADISAIRNLNGLSNTLMQPNGTLTNPGNLNISSNLAVGGNTSVTGTMGVTGAMTVGGTMGVTGAMTTNNTTVNGTLTVKNLSSDVATMIKDLVSRVATLEGYDTIKVGDKIILNNLYGGYLSVCGGGGCQYSFSSGRSFDRNKIDSTFQNIISRNG